MYTNYNDYELIYLIRDNNPNAFDLLFSKYDVLIKLIVNEMYQRDERSYDLIQEGRMLLYECINKYDWDYDVSFFSYFSICLRRKIKKELRKDYYSNTFRLKDNMAYTNNGLDERILIELYKRQYKDDELALIILEDNIKREISLIQLAVDLKINYKKLLRKKREILDSIKKSID